MLIRKATINDIKIIQELNNELFDLEIENFDENLTRDWPFSEEGEKYFKESILNNFVIVAEENGLIVGYLLAEEVDIPYYNFRIAELCNMCVKKDFRRRGIGYKLFIEFENYFKNLGVKKLIVTASFKNESARNFYKKIGFKESNISFIK